MFPLFALLLLPLTVLACRSGEGSIPYCESHTLIFMDITNKMKNEGNIEKMFTFARDTLMGSVNLQGHAVSIAHYGQSHFLPWSDKVVLYDQVSSSADLCQLFAKVRNDINKSKLYKTSVASAFKNLQKLWKDKNGDIYPSRIILFTATDDQNDILEATEYVNQFPSHFTVVSVNPSLEMSKFDGWKSLSLISMELNNEDEKTIVLTQIVDTTDRSCTYTTTTSSNQTATTGQPSILNPVDKNNSTIVSTTTSPDDTTKSASSFPLMGLMVTLFTLRFL